MKLRTRPKGSRFALKAGVLGSRWMRFMVCSFLDKRSSRRGTEGFGESWQRQLLFQKKICV